MSAPDTGRGTGPAGGPDDFDALDALAAEHVLGTLVGGERLLFARLLARDEAVRALVVGWEARLQGLADATPPAAPPPALRERVLEAVRRADAAATPGAIPDAGTAGAGSRSRVPDDPAPVAPEPPAARQVDIDLAARRSAPPAALDAAPEPAPAPRVLVRTERVAVDDSGWRTGAIAASVIAASLLALLVGLFVGVPGRDEPVPDVAVAAPAGDAGAVPGAVPGALSATAAVPSAVSLLRDEEGLPRYLVEIDASDSSVRITALDAPPVATDASLQLWMADGASGELRAIGLLPTDPWSSLRLERVPLVETEPAFAVSREPPGGSPEPGPTGDVVFQGTVHPLGEAD